MGMIFKEDFGGKVQARKGQGLKARFDAKEFAIVKGDKAITLYAYCETGDIYCYENDKKEKFAYPGLLICNVRNEAQFPGEQLMYKVLSELEERKVYTGFVHIDNEFSGAKKVLDKPELLDVFRDDLIRAESVDNPEHITDAVFGLKPTGGGKKSYTRQEMAQQRLEAFKWLMGDVDALTSVKEGLMILLEGKEPSNAQLVDFVIAIIS